MTTRRIVLLESNTTGTGRDFCAAARRLGYRPVVLSKDPARYPYLTADAIDTVVVDTSSEDQVRSTLPAFSHVAGITTSSEYCVDMAARIAVSLGLPSPSPLAVRRCRNKSTQAAALGKTGVPTPPGHPATDAKQAVDTANGLGYPVIVKPTSGSGSVGVRRCDHAEAVATHAALLLEGDSTRAVLVQRYVTGPEFSVETFDGRAVGITRKHVTDTNEFIETGHDFPAVTTPADAVALGETAERALQALGLRWGAAHVEIRITDLGPHIIEVNPRLAGGMIPRLVHSALGIDLVACCIARAVGQPPVLDPPRADGAAIRFVIAERSGMLAGVTGQADAAAVPGVVDVGMLKANGQHVTRDGSFHDRLAYVIGVASSTERAAQCCTAAASHLVVHWDTAGPNGQPAPCPT
jgi:biotin carboxylase